MSSSTPNRSSSTMTHVGVLSSPSSTYSNRLPPYRSSYRGRYHPYGRIIPRSNCKIDLMKTIDLRYEDDGRSRASISLSVVEEEEEDEFIDEEWEEGATESSSPTSDCQLGAPRSGKLLLRRRSITDLVIEFAFAMRRSLQLKRLNFIRGC